MKLRKPTWKFTVAFCVRQDSLLWQRSFVLSVCGGTAVESAPRSSGLYKKVLLVYSLSIQGKDGGGITTIEHGAGSIVPVPGGMRTDVRFRVGRYAHLLTCEAPSQTVGKMLSCRLNLVLIYFISSHGINRSVLGRIEARLDFLTVI